jgi:hypothetical protein
MEVIEPIVKYNILIIGEVKGSGFIAFYFRLSIKYRLSGLKTDILHLFLFPHHFLLFPLFKTIYKTMLIIIIFAPNNTKQNEKHLNRYPQNRIGQHKTETKG